MVYVSAVGVGVFMLSLPLLSFIVMWIAHLCKVTGDPPLLRFTLVGLYCCPLAVPIGVASLVCLAILWGDLSSTGHLILAATSIANLGLGFYALKYMIPALNQL
jgi:hypothetical protein